VAWLKVTINHPDRVFAAKKVPKVTSLACGEIAGFLEAGSNAMVCF